MDPRRVLSIAVAAVFTTAVTLAQSSDPLPSWNDGTAKKAILGFVAEVTAGGGAGFVPEEERIAVFDNDGTLWSEQPAYFQVFFALDRIRALAPDHPEWSDEEPFRSALSSNLDAVMAHGMEGIAKLVIASHAGTTTEEFESLVDSWIQTAEHPLLERPFPSFAYQPMLEVLRYLRANGFKTYIVSGGGIEFMRPWTERVYGVPPEQVVGSSIKTRFELRDGRPVIVRLPEMDFVDDGPGKPLGIHKFIGRRPIAAFGNSDGDLQMLQWTAAGPGPRLAVLIHHTDAEREWAYDRASKVGHLDKALDEAHARGWPVVSMRDDWRTLYVTNR
jgi:hypothetical protein